MNILDFKETLAFAGAIALIAVTYRHILLREPILHWWLKFGERFESKWFYPIVWGCHKCIAGQIALWYYLYWKLSIHTATETVSYFNNIPFPAHYLSSGSYSILGHLLAICGAVFISEILSKIYNTWVS